LLHVYKCVVIISVDLSLKQKIVSIFKILSEDDTEFFYIYHVYVGLFNYMVILVSMML
jgi:hypothetical protein